MTRMPALILAALIAAAPLSPAVAQERGPRGDRGPAREQSERPRIMSQSEAQRIAESRARGARYVGFVSFDGARYVYRFDDGRGRVFDVSVDARR